MLQQRVEAMRAREITDRRMTEPRAPKHQPRSLGRAFGTVKPLENMNPLAEKVADRIFRIRRDENCGSYVLADPDGKVYVLSEQALGTEAAVKRHSSWLVGRYAATNNGERPSYPSAHQMFEDLSQHFLDIGMVSPSAIYDVIRYSDD